MTFIINADTPEDMRAAIAQWLKDQSSEYHKKGMLARRKKVMHTNFAYAEMCDAAAGFIGKMKIEPLRRLPPDPIMTAGEAEKTSFTVEEVPDYFWRNGILYKRKDDEE